MPTGTTIHLLSADDDYIFSFGKFEHSVIKLQSLQPK